MLLNVLGKKNFSADFPFFRFRVLESDKYSRSICNTLIYHGYIDRFKMLY